MVELDLPLDGVIAKRYQNWGFRFHGGYEMTLTVAKIERVSTSAAGEQWDGNSNYPVFSPDGTKIAFTSRALNLVPGNVTGKGDVYVKDLSTGNIILASSDSTGNEGRGGSNSKPGFSPDSSKIAFSSIDSDLVDNDTNGKEDIFIKDLATGVMTRLSTDASGNQANSNSMDPVFSPDGSKVAFTSYASNLVPSDTNGAYDIFVKDLTTGAVTRVTTDSAGNQGNGHSAGLVFSPDGTKVSFISAASNLVLGDTNGKGDIYVKDLITGTITLISTDMTGLQGNSHSHSPIFSPDGTKIAFYSEASNLVPGDTNGMRDIFVKDLMTGEITLVSTDTAGNLGNSSSDSPVFSPDGSKIAFASYASNFSPSDTNGAYDLFVKDLVTGAITLVSTDAAGNLGNGGSGNPVFSPDGTQIAFVSGASNLVPDDTNGMLDVFVVTLEEKRSEIIHGGIAADTFYGYSGDDVIYGGGGDDTIFGGDDNDTLRGEDGDDTVFGDTGNDNVRGGAGNDVLGGGAGNDSVWGEDGDDRVRGGDGDDRLSGGLGDDDVRGGSGIDIIYGNEGNDSLGGDDGNDWLSGSSGNDLMRGDLGDDTLYGGSGDDNLRGGEGADLLYGDAGIDVLYGENGDDHLFGGSGIDTLKGGAGNDILNGGAAGDKLFGGDGADAFVFGADALSGGWDTISDFSLAQGDTLRLEGLLEGFDPLSDLITDFVRITQSHSGNSYLSVDTNGDGSGFQQIARLNGVTGLTDESALLVDGTLIIA